MSSSLLQLTPGSRDLSQTEKKILLLQAEQSHKMATIFTPWLKIKSSFCEFAYPVTTVFFSQFEINHVIQEPSEADWHKCRPP